MNEFMDELVCYFDNDKASFGKAYIFENDDELYRLISCNRVASTAVFENGAWRVKHLGEWPSTIISRHQREFELQLKNLGRFAQCENITSSSPRV